MKRWLSFVVMLLAAGAVLWYVQYRPAAPNFSQATTLPVISITQFKDIGTNLDHDIAEIIRQTAQNGIQLPQIGQWSAVQNVTQATVSASISTSPEEVWQTFREQGSQAVVSGLAKNAQVSVNDISTDVMNEARYQYCTGVVQEYERQRDQVQ
jgi:hypothetical protein